MKPKKQLTNEYLAKYFSNNFKLAIYAIKMAQHKVHEGEETTMQQILDQIRKSPPENLNSLQLEIAKASSTSEEDFNA